MATSCSFIQLTGQAARLPTCLQRCPLPKTQCLDENLGHVIPLGPGAGDLCGDQFRIKSPHGGHQVINGRVPILCRSTKMFTPLFCCKHGWREISPLYSTVNSFKCVKLQCTTSPYFGRRVENWNVTPRYGGGEVRRGSKREALKKEVITMMSVVRCGGGKFQRAVHFQIY